MKIAIISGSRSDRNALEMVRRGLEQDGHEINWGNLDLHAPRRWEHWAPVRRVEQAIAMASLDLSQLNAEPIDLVILHGDRHEILGVAVAAATMGVPIAHIGGGDITRGSQDDSFRHAITKLSHLHFVANSEAACRLLQMGEQEDRVFVTGDPGIDMVMSTPLLGREGTLRTVGLKSCERFILVSFHPNSLGDTKAELEALSGALEQRGEGIVFIGPNADEGSSLIREKWNQFVERSLPESIPVGENLQPRTVIWNNLEPKVFYSLMKHCAVMVGNSSAGFYEAPCFATPVINVGDRQDGRYEPGNVLTMPAEEVPEGLRDVLDKPNLLAANPRPIMKNPYGAGDAALQIASIIRGITEPRLLLRKQFNESGLETELTYASRNSGGD